MLAYDTHENYKRTFYICYSSITNVSRPLWWLIPPMRTIKEHVTDVTPLLEMSAATMVPYSTNENHKRTCNKCLSACYRYYPSIRSVCRSKWCVISPMRTKREHVTDVTPQLEVSAGQ